MACSTPLPSPKLYFPPCPSPYPSPAIPYAAISPLFQARKLLSIRLNSSKLDAQPNSCALQPPCQEYPEDPEPPPTSRKKKKKRKPRPSFYGQTLERWSVRITSQRSRFPWQQEGAAGSDPRVQNKRLGLIIEKLDGSLNHNGLDCGDEEKVSTKANALSSSPVVDENSPVGKPLRSPLGSFAAPWVHGPKAKAVCFDAVSNEDNEKRRDDLAAKKLSGRLDDSGLDCSDKEDVNAEEIAQDSSLVVDENSKLFGGLLGSHKARHKKAHFDAISRKDENQREDLTVEKPNGNLHSSPGTHLRPDSDEPCRPTEQNPMGNGILYPTKEHADFSEESEKSKVSLIVEEPKSSLEQNVADPDVGIYLSDSDEEQEPNFGRNGVKPMGAKVLFPWERDNDGDDDWERQYKRSNTELAEKTIPEPELRRLRNVALRMKERMKVGVAGVTEAVVESIHKKWRESEVVKIRFEGPPSLNMKRTHEILEGKTGGLVIWRSGSSLVLYRGMTYELPCVKSYSKLANDDSNQNDIPSSIDYTTVTVGNIMNDIFVASKKSDADSMASSVNLSKEFTDTSEIDHLLDQLGPRYKDWSGCNPLPVDADMLPSIIPGYKPPYRLLPYKTRRTLHNREMTSLRRLARSMPPHFCLGRNRQHEGLAQAIVKLWEKSAIAKIAIKRGVPNTCNERMAEEIKKLTGGTLLSRNKDYIVFYRGNDFLIPSIRVVLVEKQKLATVKQDEEEMARLRASAIVSDPKGIKSPLVAGTLAETMEAKTRWGNQPSHEDREKMRREKALANQASLVRYLERKLALAKAKVRKAEKALAKVQEFLQPAELPSDLETVTDEERFLYRKMGLKMRAFLHLGRRGVFDGTIQNMHLSWKHRELVKIFVKRKTFTQVKQIAISLEAESGGVLISLDKTTKGYAIIMYRGKNYQRPQMLKPKNLLTRRQALARSIELQRREALNHHIANLREKIQLMKFQLDRMEADKEVGTEGLDLQIDKAFFSDDDVEDEGEEAYLETYNCGEEDNDASLEVF